MNSRFLSPSPVFACLALALTSASAISAFAQSSEWSGTCQVHFAGKSTLHDFDGTVTAEPFSVKIANFDTPAQASATSVVSVKAAKMDTGNEKRDKAMRKCMEVDTFPEITVSVKDLSPELTSPRMEGPMPEPTVIPFKMSLKGKTHDVTGKVSDWSYREDKISCTVSFPVSLSAAGIKPPSVLGMVKVDDRIEVAAHLKLSR